MQDHAVNWLPKNETKISEQDGVLQFHIPLFEISDADGLKIRQAAGDVFLQISTSLSTENNVVEVDLWYSSSLDLGLKLSDELAALSFSFKNDHVSKPLFTPRIATFDCLDCAEDFKKINCLSDGAYCSYTPKFFDDYKLKNSDFEFTGREILFQALREKCLHDLVSTKYQDEGVLFWTFFQYLDECFVENGPRVTSLDECFDWSTVLIDGHEEVDSINACVENSFSTPSEYESDNSILRSDKVWSVSMGLQFHPSISINNHTYHGDISGQKLAFAICEAYDEKPDECDLSWAIKTYQ